MVYEPFFRYKELHRFLEVDLTTSQVDIKEKYLEKDKCQLEFFEVIPEYANKVLKFLTDKYLKSSFPINIKSGELQGACIDFIAKCTELARERGMINDTTTLPSPALIQQPPVKMITLPTQQKAIALVSHHSTRAFAVVCNNDSLSPQDFLSRLPNEPLLVVYHHAILEAASADEIMRRFHTDFQSSRCNNNELGLTWYTTSESEVLRWLNSRPSSSSSPPEVFNTDIFIDDSLPDIFPSISMEHDYAAKKRKFNWEHITINMGWITILIDIIRETLK